jgi:hypothetical protein
MSAPELHGTIEVKFNKSKIKEDEVEKKVRKAIRGNTYLEDEYDSNCVKWEYDSNNNLCISIEQWQTWEFDSFLNELIEDLDKTGKTIWLDGQVNAYGDDDWFYDISHNKLSEHEKTEEALFYASDKTLIEMLEKRGYTVTKKRGKK